MLSTKTTTDDHRRAFGYFKEVLDLCEDALVLQAATVQRGLWSGHIPLQTVGGENPALRAIVNRRDIATETVISGLDVIVAINPNSPKHLWGLAADALVDAKAAAKLD